MDFSAIEIPGAQDEASLWLSALLIQDGQAVEKGQLLARLESHVQRDLLIDLFSPGEGYIVGLRAVPGQIVQPGDILCYICSHPSIASVKPGPRITMPETSSFDPGALVIFGGGGHAKIVIDIVRAMGTYRLVGIFDDGLPEGSEVLGLPVLGSSKDLVEWRSRGIQLAANGVGGIGNYRVRLKIFEMLAQAGYHFPVLVHPSAVVERSAILETGAQVMAQAYIGASVRVGFGSVINVGAIVSHDSVLGQVVNLSPGATLAGNVRVENYAQIGMRATVNVNITVGEGAMLGNGCTVKADVPANTRVRAGTIWPIPKNI